MITTRLRSGMGVSSSFFLHTMFILLVSYLFLRVVLCYLCPYDSYILASIRTVRYFSFSYLFVHVCYMWYLYTMLSIYYFILLCSLWILHVHKLPIAGRLATLK